MSQILYDSPIGYHLYNSNGAKRVKKAQSDEENEENKYYIKSEYLFKSNAEALESIAKLNNNEVPQTLKGMLKNIKTEIIVSDKTMKDNLSDIHANIKINLSEYRKIKKIFCQDKLVELQKVTYISHKIISEKMNEDVDRQDLMIIHAIKIIDDLDKDINLHTMKLREWYGFHFPELSNIVPDNNKYLKCLLCIGVKEDFEDEEKLTKIVNEDVMRQIVEVSKLSMGTEINEEDIEKILDDTKSTLQMVEYKKQLSEYLEEKMQVIAPNIYYLVGPVMGARLISKAGSLIELSKCPASTVQIMGAEKALFSALKSRKDTPKYGFIYHANLVSKADAKQKGKIARMLACKISLAAKVDCYSEDRSGDFGHKILKELMTKIDGIASKGGKSSKRKSVKVIK